MQATAIIMIVLVSFFMGAFSMLGYMLWRMMRNDGWDDSNITNALRVLSHVVLHAEDFRKMYYLTGTQIAQLRQLQTYGDEPMRSPFWYVTEDEFEGVVKTRPPEDIHR